MYRTTVDSSNIKSIGRKDGVVEVEFKNGDVWQYSGVPEKVSDELLMAESKGVFFSQHIKDAYEGKKVERDSPDVETSWQKGSVVKELLYGLITDGAHHKQYHLERVLRLLCTDKYVDEAKKEFQWEEGIAP
jgi:hypothetical protein